MAQFDLPMGYRPPHRVLSPPAPPAPPVSSVRASAARPQSPHPGTSGAAPVSTVAVRAHRAGLGATCCPAFTDPFLQWLLLTCSFGERRAVDPERDVQSKSFRCSSTPSGKLSAPPKPATLRGQSRRASGCWGLRADVHGFAPAGHGVPRGSRQWRNAPALVRGLAILAGQGLAIIADCRCVVTLGFWIGGTVAARHLYAPWAVAATCRVGSARG